jgi:hypothetical protein
MLDMRTFILFLTLLCSTVALQAQNTKLVVVNGGQFGTTNYANVMVKDLATGISTTIDTIYKTSIQDVLIDGDYAYVAAQDSIIKYDLTTNSRVAASDFAGGSTIKLAKHGNNIIVGNWYAPWGHVGPYNFHLNIYAASNLSLLDSVPQIKYPAKDFVIVGDSAYVAQNAGSTAGYSDTLGFLAVVDLTNFTVTREILLSSDSLAVGRIVAEGNTVFSLNNISNTISSYNISTGATSTAALASNLDLNVRGNGPAAQYYNNAWYFAYDSGIGSYDLMNNAIIDANIVTTSSKTFALDTVNSKFYVAEIGFSSAGKGLVYDMNGDSINTFDVGISSEALAIYHGTANTSVTEIAAAQTLAVYPNPTSNILNVSLGASAHTLMIYNQTGQLVWNTTGANETVQIDVNQLTSGIYFLNAVTAEGAVKTVRFIKQ